MKMKLFSKQKGFTLIEVLVVIFITAIISGIMVVGFRQGAKSNQLQRSAQIVIQNLRKVQNMALSSITFTNPSSGQKEVPAGGYAAEFNKGAGINTFYLYADFNSNKSRNAGEDIEAVQLESNIFFDAIYYLKEAQPPQSANSTNIICSSPYASMEFQPPLPPADIVVITIKKSGATCSGNCKQGVTCSADPDCKAIKIAKLTGQISLVK